MVLKSKDDLLTKLRSYSETPDDESVRYKEIIKKKLLNCPELLYALNSKELESELFDDNGNLLIDEETGELLGDVSSYFGDNSLIRPYLFLPETQTKVVNYICYQVMFDEIPKYSDRQKYTEITFNIFVHGENGIDELTGIPRHDLISSIIREKFNWSNIFGLQTKLTRSKESITDNNYIVRTLIFEISDINGIVETSYDGKTMTNNYKIRR